MENNYSNNNEIVTFLYLIIIIVILACISLAIYYSAILPFLKEREYIKMEMGRSFDDDEYLYWKRELKQLYLSFLLGRFFK